jgi:hypothetical protein
LGEEGDHREAEETADEVSGEQAGGLGAPGAARQDALGGEEQLIVSTTPSRSARQNKSLSGSQTLDARPGSHRLHRLGS